VQAPPIEGVSKVIDAFGYFPSFHDGEIIELHLLRNTTPHEDWPTVSLLFTLHGWEVTSEVTPEGFYRLTKHHLLKFRFDHVDSVDLRFFNHQNVISALSIERIEPPTDHALIQIEFGSCFGLEGGFRAVTGSVEDISPCDEEGIPIDSSSEQAAAPNRSFTPVPKSEIPVRGSDG
jgi:hypothetical protein